MFKDTVIDNTDVARDFIIIVYGEFHYFKNGHFQKTVLIQYDKTHS